MKRKQVNTTSKQEAYFVPVIDLPSMERAGATPDSNDHIVVAGSAEEAERKAVADDNVNHGYGPDEDGGFIAVRAYTRAQVQNLIDLMIEKAKASNPPTAP